jgi:hypothetical protein
MKGDHHCYVIVITDGRQYRLDQSDLLDARGLCFDTGRIDRQMPVLLYVDTRCRDVLVMPLHYAPRRLPAPSRAARNAVPGSRRSLNSC